MGRLTLNVLLSFAQFEREMTGERIRDKIAASKRKGMWMGGVVPRGYDLHARRLVTNPAQAEVVRQIFQRYLELGCVRLLKNDLDRRDVVSKLRTSSDGTPSGGCSFSRGALYLLSNPLYRGEIRHKGVCYPGQHEPIVDRELWEKAQQQLRDHTVRRHTPTNQVGASPLARKLLDESGECLTPSHAAKGGQRYRYYVSRNLTNGTAQQAQHGWRLPASEIEKCVATAVRQLLRERATIASAAQDSGVAANQIQSLLEVADSWSARLESAAEAARALAELVDRVELRTDGIQCSLRLPMPDPNGQEALRNLTIGRFVPMQLKRRGVELRLVIEDQHSGPRHDDPALLKAVGRAHRWFKVLTAREAKSIAAIAQHEGLTARYVSRLMRLAFLAPQISEAIAAGKQPPELTTQLLTTRGDFAIDWREQMRTLGFA